MKSNIFKVKWLMGGFLLILSLSSFTQINRISAYIPGHWEDNYLDKETFETCNANDHWVGSNFEKSGDYLLGYNFGLVHYQLNGIPFNLGYILGYIGQKKVPLNYNVKFRNQQCQSYKVTVWGDGVPTTAIHLVQNNVYHPEELAFDLQSYGLDDGKDIMVWGDVMTTSPQRFGGKLNIKLEVTARFEVYYIVTYRGIPIDSGSYGFHTYDYSRTFSMSTYWVPDLP